MTKNKPSDDSGRIDTGLITLVAVLAATLVTAQVSAAKLIPIDLPLLGTIMFTGGSFAYAATYTMSDCITEVYGSDTARRAVIGGFVGNVALFALLWLVVALPAAPGGAPQSAVEAILGSGTNIIIGSMSAYLVSQTVDISVFDRLRDLSGGRFLWFRNNGSTFFSQAIDTVIYVGVAFYVAPLLFGIGVTLPAGAFVAVLVGDYISKALLAAADTPFVYAITGYLKRRGPGHDTATPTTAD